MLKLAMVMAVTAASVAMGGIASNEGPAYRLESAIYSEAVRGDLKAAIAQYRGIVSDRKAPRSVAGRAAYRLGLCLERAGRLSEARETYSRVLRDFADQGVTAAAARARLSQAGETIAGPLNLRFDEGAPNKLPAAWFVPAMPADADNWAQLRKSGCVSPKGSCAVVMAPENAPVHVSNLMQSFSAKAYRGRTVRFRAAIRLDATAASDHAQMWLSVDRGNAQKGFFDNMSDRPIRSQTWSTSEIRTRIDEDATYIKFGIMSVGRGRVWVDGVSFDTVP